MDNTSYATEYRNKHSRSARVGLETRGLVNDSRQEERHMSRLHIRQVDRKRERGPND